MSKQPVKKTIENEGQHDEEIIEDHPAFGLIAVDRSGGGGSKLFGSPLAYHPVQYTITVREAQRVHSNSYDRYVAKKHVMQIRISSAQFVDLITNQNIGDGIPCTIERVREGDFKPVPEIPDDDPVETERTVQSFKRSLKTTFNAIAESISEAEKLFEQKTISKKDKERIMFLLYKSKQDMESNYPFVVEMFAEAASKVVAHGKAEIDSFLNSLIRQTGLEALREKGAELLRLGPAKTDEGK